MIRRGAMALALTVSAAGLGACGDEVVTPMPPMPPPFDAGFDAAVSPMTDGGPPPTDAGAADAGASDGGATMDAGTDAGVIAPMPPPFDAGALPDAGGRDGGIVIVPPMPPPFDASIARPDAGPGRDAGTVIAPMPPPPMPAPK